MKEHFHVKMPAGKVVAVAILGPHAKNLANFNG